MWLGPGEKLQASWKSRDPESDISTIEFCVGTVSVGCQVKSMTELSSNATNIACNECQVRHQGAYYITIRVKNGAGVYTVATTDEIKVDLTAPFVGKVIPVNDITSCTTNCTLVANVTFFQDNESGVKSCSYAVRNSSHLIADFVNNGLDKTVEATALQLVAGARYYTVVRCENNVGLVTEQASTIPVLVDDTPPTKVNKNHRGVWGISIHGQNKLGYCLTFAFIEPFNWFKKIVRSVTNRNLLFLQPIKKENRVFFLTRFFPALMTRAFLFILIGLLPYLNLL